MKLSVKIVFFSLVLLAVSFAQQNHTLMSYNLLNYPGTDTTTRNPYFRTVIASSQPDILVAQEVISQAGVNGFLDNVLNIASSGYAAGLFIDGLDTDNAIFYKTNLFTFLSNIPVKTALRDINEFRLKHNVTGDTLIIYSVHLKASSTTEDELKRAAEVDSLRKRTSALHSGSYFVIVGDFNIYRSSESAFQKLLNQSNTGYVVDPLNLIGTWNNSVFAIYHTQSPRTRQFGGGANGGLDDRFDMILPSQNVYTAGGISLVPGSTVAYGNDGLHYNDSINRPPNNAVGQEIANALHYASDHLPLIASFLFDNPLPVEHSFSPAQKYELAQNFPNPFNPNTSIKFTLPETGNVKLTVYNMLGQEIATLVNGVKEAGTHIINFNCRRI